MKAWTDFHEDTIYHFGRDKRGRFMDLVNMIWRNGGVGDYPGGAVHADSRGYCARSSSY